MLAGQTGAGKSGPGYAGGLNLGAGALGALKSESGMGASRVWAPSCIGRSGEVVNQSSGLRTYLKGKSIFLAIFRLRGAFSKLCARPESLPD